MEERGLERMVEIDDDFTPCPADDGDELFPNGYFVFNVTRIIEYIRDNPDDITLALLHLVVWERKEGLGARAWKSFDWDTMDRLHEKGYIADPKNKAKSVVMTEEGCSRSEALFDELFLDRET